MTIKIDKETINKNTGIIFYDNENYIYYMQRLIYDLYTHNKNYTKKQYYKILDLYEILNNLEVLENETSK